MKCKLYANIKRITTGFCLGIFCVTLSVLALRLTVFSDMAAAPEKNASSIVSNEDDGYQINDKIYFSGTGSKGNVFIKNLSSENLIKVDITLADDGTSILSTGFINPGASINSSRLNPDGQKLKDGQYACVAEIAAYDPDDLKTVIGSAKIDIEVYIGEKPEKSKDKDKDDSSDDAQ